MSSPKTALIVWGGWDVHTPKAMAELFAGRLSEKGFRVSLENGLTPLEQKQRLKRLDLIVPMWTMGTLSPAQWQGLNEAVRSGVGLGGVHGGMGDAFRGHPEYEWMCGGHFVGHPYAVSYTHLTLPTKRIV